MVSSFIVSQFFAIHKQLYYVIMVQGGNDPKLSPLGESVSRKADERGVTFLAAKQTNIEHLQPHSRLRRQLPFDTGEPLGAAKASPGYGTAVSAGAGMRNKSGFHIEAQWFLNWRCLRRHHFL